MSTTPLNRVIRLPELEAMIGLKRSSIYSRMNSQSKQYDATFPKSVSLSSSGKGSIGWRLSEVMAWLDSLMSTDDRQ